MECYILLFKTLATIALLSPFVFVIALVLSLPFIDNLPKWYDYLLKFILGVAVVSFLLRAGIGLFFVVGMLWS